MSIACLPWYDFEEIRPHTDRFWASVSSRLADAGFDHAPGRLTREVDHDEILAQPDLVLSQTCGYVVVCDELGARELDDLRGLRCAINEPWSHSGVNSIRSLIATRHSGGRFFGEVIRSGGHVRSLDLIRTKHADVACIDCVTYELARRQRPALLEGLHVVCATPPAPAPPFVTAARAPAALVDALADAIGDVLIDPPNDDVCDALLIGGIERLAIDAYDGMLIAARRARDAGYTEMFF